MKDFREVLQHVPAFLSEKQGTSLNDLNALKVCSQEREQESHLLGALLRVAYVGRAEQRHTHMCAPVFASLSRIRARVFRELSRPLLPTAPSPVEGQAHPHAPQRNGGRRRGARGAEAQPLPHPPSSCQQPPLRANAPSRREKTRLERGKNATKRRRPLRGRGAPLRDPFLPPRPAPPFPARELCRRAQATLPPRGGKGGKREEAASRPFHLRLGRAQWAVTSIL